MKKKSLGELLCKAFGFDWTQFGRAARLDFQETAERFLDSCGTTLGFLAPAIERMVRAAAAARTVNVELTSPAVASKAAKALRSKRTSKAGRSIAASALTQTANRRKRK